MAAEPLGDPHVSRAALRIIRLADGRVRFDKRETPTQVIVDGIPLDKELDVPGHMLDRGVVIELAGRVALLLKLCGTSIDDGDDLGLLGDSAEIIQVRQDVRRISSLEVTVLVVGETGSGKELVARAIHRSGARRDKPFVAVNMGAVPPSLASAELFGAERGAFTGSVRNQLGHFRAAGDGTLFLDEIGETPPEVQALLLRALDTGEVIPLGTSDAKVIRARLIAATDADLLQRVEQSTFRAPLLHRLASYTLTVPPLRARRDDIGRLFMHFLRAELGASGEWERVMADSVNPFVPAWLAGRLARFDWPGNVRQLRNAARQLALGSRGAECLCSPEALDRLLVWTGQSSPPEAELVPSSKEENRRKPAEVSEQELLTALRTCRWDLKATAQQLRISRTSLYALVETSGKVRRVSDLGLQELEQCHRECSGDIDRMVDRLEVSRHALQRRLREIGLT